MITSQNIREKTFEKAVFGGYDMAAVDAFLEEIAADLELMQKENYSLKGKLKVLANKVEEYRGSEDALRAAVISAQKLGGMIESEAREKADGIIEQAKAEAERIERESRLRAEVEAARLEEAKRSGSEFIENMNLIVRRQGEFLERLSSTDFVKSLRSAPREGREVRETVKSIEENVARVAEDSPVDLRGDVRSAVDTDADNQPTRSFNVASGSATSAVSGDETAMFNLDI